MADKQEPQAKTGDRDRPRDKASSPDALTTATRKGDIELSEADLSGISGGDESPKEKKFF